ncbi:MAG: IscA/HesB family protein [Desulfobulbaceae bacterium]|nr:IscA/HesB family protein [Desulfobulbaceae bacterium]
MIEMTDAAEKKLKQYLEENKIDSPVRVFIINGCSGPSLGFSLDQQKEEDNLIEQGAVQILVSRELAELCGTIKIDFIEPSTSSCGCGGNSGGFSLSSERPLPGSGCGCGSSCSSGSCG